MNCCDLRRRSGLRFYAFIAVWVSAALACARADVPPDYGHITPLAAAPATGTAAVPPQNPAATDAVLPQPTAAPVVTDVPPATPWPTPDTSSPPTPDPTHPSPLGRDKAEVYVVRRDDTLGSIGQRYGVTAAEIAQANGITENDVLHVGQKLLIPIPTDKPHGPDVKLIPDSELVYGPGAARFNVRAYVETWRGYLADYSEDVPGGELDGSADYLTLSGVEIVQLVAERYSVNPRLLLALLEFQSGWLTNPNPRDSTLTYPMRHVEAGRSGLYRQLKWTANQLNAGYYAWRAGWLVSWLFLDGSLRLVAPDLNAGTVGVQNLFAQLLGVDDWQAAVSPDGFIATYRGLFGSPFALGFDPIAPPDLVQPPLQLPFEQGKTWAYTGGPHGAWDSGSAWAALDFAPPAEAEGCTPSDEWVAASAPGLVVRSQYGAVVEDLDGDGYEGTGWDLLYMHLETRDRVPAGTRVAAGDRLGHPSCEGGFANGTHTHLARKYNGEWIPADGPIPFVLDGWISAGLEREYDGTLNKGEVSLEACDCRAVSNEIARP